MTEIQKEQIPLQEIESNTNDEFNLIFLEEALREFRNDVDRGIITEKAYGYIRDVLTSLRSISLGGTDLIRREDALKAFPEQLNGVYVPNAMSYINDYLDSIPMGVPWEMIRTMRDCIECAKDWIENGIPPSVYAISRTVEERHIDDYVTKEDYEMAKGRDLIDRSCVFDILDEMEIKEPKGYIQKNTNKTLLTVLEKIASLSSFDGNIGTVKHGTWVKCGEDDEDIMYKCSLCGDDIWVLKGDKEAANINYCSGCGAKMEYEE